MVFLNGDAIADLDARGIRVVDDSFLMAFNAHFEDIDLTLPDGPYGDAWSVVVDSSTGLVRHKRARRSRRDTTTTLPARSLVVLQRVGGAGS